MGQVRSIAPHLRTLDAPEPLRALPGWLLWRYETHEGDKKPRKVPYYANGSRRHGQQGSPQDRAQLTAFAAARDAAIRLGYTGVGLAMLPDWNVTALDVDHCVGPDGSLPPEIEAITDCTYAEYSPSGAGIRAFFQGHLGNNKSRADGDRYGLETFASNGFVTFTGNILPHVDLLGYEDRVAPLPEALVTLCQTRFGTSAPAKVDPEDFMIGREPKLGLSVERMEELLADLDPDMGREDWIKVGMALHHECEGDDTGFELWNEWSACGGKYPSEEGLRAQWDSFDRRKGAARRQVTMASVIKMVKDAAVSPDALRKVATEASLMASTSTLGVTPPDYDGKFPLRRAGDIARLPAGKWWIKGLLPKAQIGAIFGASGSGKSFLALDFMAHLSLGRTWRGKTVAKARGLYIAAEGGTGVGKRIKAWAQHNKVNADDLDISVLTVPPNILLRDDIEELVRSVTLAGGFDYIVMDTYAQVTPGANENGAEDMGKALSHCRALFEATGAMVILVHHSGKDASRGVRGWSGINAALDFAIETSRAEGSDYREARVTKMKDGEDGLTFGFKLEVIMVGMDEDLEEVTSCVISEAETPKGEEKETGKGVKRRGRVENHVLETMTLFGSADTVKLHELVDQAVATMPLPEKGERDTRRQRVVRAIQQLGKEKDGPLQVKDNLVIFYE